MAQPQLGDRSLYRVAPHWTGLPIDTEPKCPPPLQLWMLSPKTLSRRMSRILESLSSHAAEAPNQAAAALPTPALAITDQVPALCKGTNMSNMLLPLRLPAVVTFLVMASAMFLPATSPNVRAQTSGEADGMWHVGMSYAVAYPMGAFAKSMNTFSGAVASYHFGSYKHALGLRADVGFMRYGKTSRPLRCFPEVCRRVQLTEFTSNDVYLFYIGPEWVPALDRRIVPYLSAGIGIIQFKTHSSLIEKGGGFGDDVDLLGRRRTFGDVTHSRHTSLSWKAGGGARVAAWKSVSLTVSGHFHGSGYAQYHTNADIETLHYADVIPTEDRIRFFSLVLGISFPL